MFEVIIESQPHDYQSLEILKEAYSKLGREKDVVKTSKRIAEAYVQMGQLSSAILEYETILQRCPEDPDVQAALKDIESKASNFAEESAMAHAASGRSSGQTQTFRKTSDRSAPTKVEDGRDALYKIFVDGKLITAGDFDLCWIAPDLSAPPNGIIEPFIQILADKGIQPVEKSLKVLSDATRLPFLPLEKYDPDIEMSRSFPAKVCQRWCVLPFDRMSKSVLVATANPFNQQAARELAEATSYRLLWYLTTPVDLVKNLRKTFR